MVSYKKYYFITYQNNFSTNRKHHFQNLIIKRFTTEYNPTNLLIKDMQHFDFRFLIKRIVVHVSRVSQIMTSHTTYKFSDFSHIESRTWRRSVMCPGLPVSKFAGSVCYLEQGWARFDQLFIS